MLEHARKAAERLVRTAVSALSILMRIVLGLWTRLLQLYYARDVDVAGRARQLRLKVPKHIALLAPSDGPDCLQPLARLAAECALLGCSYVTVFDSNGSLRERLRDLALATDRFVRRRGADTAPDVAYTDGRLCYCLRPAAAAGDAPDWCPAKPQARAAEAGSCLIRAMRAGEGHEEIASETRTAARMRLAADARANGRANGSLDPAASPLGRDWPEADLALVLGEAPSARGYPPAALRFTELAHAPRHGLAPSALLAALLRFSRTTQNYGT